MPIEFPCPQCGKLLRVGDDAAGKQARCPACNSVQAIPSAHAATNPFGASAPRSTGGEPEINPYQAPFDFPVAPVAPAAPAPWGAKRPIQPTVIGILEPIDSVRQICSENFSQVAMCLVAMIICGAINYAGQLVMQVVMMAIGAVNPPLIITIVVVAACFVALVIFQAWIGLGQTLYFLRTARGEETSLGVLFAGGPYLLATIVATIIVAVGACGIALLCAIPGLAIYALTREPAAGVIAAFVLYAGGMLYLSLVFYQYYFLIPDQGLSGLEALRISKEITKGNRLTLFGLGLIAICVIFVSLLLFCFPVFFAVPIVMLGATITYLKMAGQPTADERHLQPSTTSPFAPPNAELR